MVCPRCDSVRNFNDFNFDFSLPIHYIDIRTDSKYQAESILDETVLKIDGDIYEIDGIKDIPEGDVQQVIDELEGNGKLESAAAELPSNHPHQYDATPYLSRHLSTKLSEDLVALADETNANPQLVLLVAYAKSKNSELGKSSEELKYYIQSRDQLAKLVTEQDEFKGRIEREFVSFLLLSMTLIETLSYEILFKELYREEHRHESNRSQVSNLPYGRCLNHLYNNEILNETLKDRIKTERNTRNNIAHNLMAHTELRNHGVGWVRGRMESLDKIITDLLDLSTITGSRVIAEYGPEAYIQQKLKAENGAIDDTRDHWEAEHPDEYSALVESGRVNFTELEWEIEIGSSGTRDVKTGVDFTGLPSNSDEADETQTEFYNLLMEFLHCCEDRLLREIERDMDAVNLDRREFMLAALLIRGKVEAENPECETSNRYEWVCANLPTTPKFVQRKENVLAWRAGGEVRERLGDVLEPSEVVQPFQ